MAYLQRGGSIGWDLKALDDAHGAYTVGRNKDLDFVIDGDDSISSVHAELSRKGPAWCIEDLGALNGTFVNGDRITSKRVLKDGDTIRLGRTNLIFRDGSNRDGTTKRTNTKAPEITKTERAVLVELCRPWLTGTVMSSAAPVETIAAALSVGQAAVRAHIGHLHDKFGIDEGRDRRDRLARDVVERGVVTPKDYT
jgi:hypothetical protein